VLAFVACTGQEVILPNNQQAVLDCAASSRYAQKFAECAAPELGYRLSDKVRVLASCVMRSRGSHSSFLKCASGSGLDGEIAAAQEAALKCAADAAGSVFKFANCATPPLIGSPASSELHTALECAALLQENYGSMVSCLGANFFNLQLNIEQQIIVQCVAAAGGQPHMAVGCMASRLTGRELVKCATAGFGGSRGCFADETDSGVKHDWSGRTMAQIVAKPDSIIRNPTAIWGGDNSFVRNPIQIFSGTNHFVQNPSRFWGHNYSNFHDPDQLSPRPLTLGSVGEKRICLPWC
jgi:hypothetical protein